VAGLGQAWESGGWEGVLRGLDGIWLVPDFALWSYVIFAASNAMIPSPADRQPWLVAGIYIVTTLALAYMIGGLPVMPAALTAEVAGLLQSLTLAFLFTLALDLLVAAGLWLAEAVLELFQRPMAPKKQDR